MSILRKLHAFDEEDEASQRKVQADRQLWRLAHAAVTATPSATVAALIGDGRDAGTAGEREGEPASPASSSGSKAMPNNEWDTPVVARRVLPAGFSSVSGPGQFSSSNSVSQSQSQSQSPSPLAPARCLLRSPLLAKLVAQHTMVSASGGATGVRAAPH